MGTQIKKIGLITGGGDCPGLNAAIRAVVQSCVPNGIDVVGVADGFKGLVEDRFIPLTLENTTGILSKGGTILGSSNVDTPFEYHVAKGKTEDRSDEAVANFKKQGLEALIVVGGDGTQTIAHEFSKKGIKVVGIPKTIDNDLAGTEFTIGFFTAVQTAVQAMDRLHSTAESHQRIMVVEVMGRYAGWIGLFAGLGGDADVILIPEIPFDLKKVVATLKDGYHTTKKYSIVIVSEGAKPVGGEMTVQAKVDSPAKIRLGGIAHQVASELEELTGREARAIVLGHLLRGGSPEAFDRILASRFGAAAVRAILDGNFDTLVSYKNDTIRLVPLETGAGKTRSVDAEANVIRAARMRGISFGD